MHSPVNSVDVGFGCIAPFLPEKHLTDRGLNHRSSS